MQFAPRLLQVAGEAALRRELQAAGADLPEAVQLAAELDRLLIRFSAVPTVLASKVNTAIAPLGGTAMVLAGGDTGCAELILSATPTVLRLFSERLAGQPDGMAELGAELTSLLRGVDQPPAVLCGRTCRIPLSRPLIMGVLNVTPDSFSDGGSYFAPAAAVRKGLEMAAEGADLIDIGGESTRPGSSPVSAGEELERVLPVIEALRGESAVPLCIDTSKAEVARQALAAGVEFVNDISGLHFDPEMADVVAGAGAGLFLMHTRGRPAQMQNDTVYRDLMGEVISFLRNGINLAVKSGLPLEKIAVDPGIGFGKSVQGNLEILQRLGELRSLGRPILLGTSRKGFIGRVLGEPDPHKRLFGSVATVVLGVAAGAHVFRVHDVRPTLEAARMAWAVRGGELPQLD